MGGEEIWEWEVLRVRGRTVAKANLKNSRDRRVVRERSLPGSLPQHLFARGPNLLRGCEEMKRLPESATCRRRGGESWSLDLT